jgi:co-chaperonin GroES (HSP10)
MYDLNEFQPTSHFKAVNASRFFLDRANPSGQTAKLLGHRVLIYRVEMELYRAQSGLLLADHWKHGSYVFKVMAVGPGGWAKHTGKKGKAIWTWLKPEVDVNDFCVSYHWKTAPAHPSWIQPTYLDNVDGSGRIVLDCRFIEASWKE